MEYCIASSLCTSKIALIAADCSFRSPTVAHPVRPMQARMMTLTHEQTRSVWLSLSLPLQFVHDARDQLFGVVQVFQNHLEVHRGFTRLARTLAINSVLADEDERVCQDVERDGEPSALDAHHRLVAFELILPLV